ncbi:MAG: 50S ribosomal protein L4 [Verrucomicrobia subdivision 3 bacterium]|nr:50S ribosomal protein L4 [Limisphaerales bacterium]MCS1416001.1 50S ribosomal protein L4 [Limisphaerales bacterium]
MNIKVKDTSGAEVGDYEVKFDIIADGRGTQAVHDAVVAYTAAQRSGTACTKTVAEVAGSGRKPWRQKGTGRARAGYLRSPIWRGGGVVFGPKPRSFQKTVSKKTKRLALRKALSERFKGGDVHIVNAFEFEKPSTKGFLGVCESLGLSGTTLIVADSVNENLILSARNIPYVDVTLASTLNTYDVLKYDHLVFAQGAIEAVDNRLVGKGAEA